MKTNEFNRFVQQRGMHVFSLNDAARIMKTPKHYATIFLSRNMMIKRAERGIYYTPDASIYEIATSIVYPSYASMISALRFHNLTEQIPSIIYVVSSKQHRNLEVEGIKIEFSKVKPSLIYGYLKMDGAFIAEPEKAVVDIFYLDKFVEYAVETIENRKLDIGKLIHYAEISRNKNIQKRILKIIKTLGLSIKMHQKM